MNDLSELLEGSKDCFRLWQINSPTLTTDTKECFTYVYKWWLDGRGKGLSPRWDGKCTAASDWTNFLGAHSPVPYGRHGL